jgi:glycosyltransferase involved in cell wall biosynthesis
MIDAVMVVVPAHDEEELLPRCIASLRRAAAHPALTDISIRVAVVLDRCSDASGDHAVPLLRAGDRLLERRDGNVGAARRSGIEALLHAEAGRAPSSIWLATTDADSRVPADWLARQLRLADEGADAIAGTVSVDDWHQHPHGSRRAFEASYAQAMDGTVHRHVHGANLGVRASTYNLVGGVAGVPLGEDNAFVEALELFGVTIARPRALRVITSGRREGRVSAGFSKYLRELAVPSGS